MTLGEKDRKINVVISFHTNTPSFLCRIEVLEDDEGIDGNAHSTAPAHLIGD